MISIILLICAEVWGAPTTAPAENAPVTRGSTAKWLNEAERQRELGSCHLEAEALENALAALPAGDPARWTSAERLIDLYRGGMGRVSRAAYWARTMADELRSTPAGVDALSELADICLNNGHVDEALARYQEIRQRIAAMGEAYDSSGKRRSRRADNEGLARAPEGTDPLFPSDLTVTNQANQFLQLARSGQSKEACALLDRNLPLRSLISLGQGPQIWQSAREWLLRASAQIPKDSMRSFDAFYNGKIAELAGRPGWEELSTFRFQHPLPELQRRVDESIANELLDLGLPALAASFYGEALQNARANAPPSLLARELFARIQAGEQVSAAEMPDVQVEVAGERRSLRAWADAWKDSGSESTTQPASIDLADGSISRLHLLREPLLLREWHLRWRDKRGLARWRDDRGRPKGDLVLPAFAEEFVPCIPAGSPRCLVVNLGNAVQAVDVVEGRTLWTFQAPEENSTTFENQKWRNKELYVQCARAGTVAIAGDRLYCRLGWGKEDTFRDAGGIFALRYSDGTLLWSSLQLPELADMQFAADPAVYRGVVVALAWRPRERIPFFYLVGMAAETGKLLWVTHLFSGGSMTVRDDDYYLDRPRACGPPQVVDGVAYLCTGAGVAVAANVLDGTLAWATTYPRVKAINSAAWATRAAISRPAGIIAVQPDVVLLAPIDSYHLVAIDRVTGQARYTKESLDLRAIAAADAERAYLVEGTSLRAIRPADGQTVWQRELPTDGLVGLPTLSSRGLLCPSWEALYLLEPSSGEIRSRRPWSRDEACGYLQDYGDRLVGASCTGLHVLVREPLKDDENWRLPASDNEEPGDVRVPARSDKALRWVLPGADRGDFVLSGADPEHLLVRSDLLQMRQIDPLPALRWERSSPLPLGCEAVFDRNRVAVWDDSELVVLDAASGRTLWESRLPIVSGAPNRSRQARQGRVVLAGDDLLWWEGREVRSYQASTGEKRWTVQPEATIRGVCGSQQGVGLYLEPDAASTKAQGYMAVLLDSATGNEKARFAILRPPPVDAAATAPARRSSVAPAARRASRTRSATPARGPAPAAMIVGQIGPGPDAAGGDVVLIDGVLPVRVDWTGRSSAAGEALEAPIAGGTTLEICGDYACLRGDTHNRLASGREPLLAVWNRKTLARIRVPAATAWCISGDNLYAFADRRMECVSLGDGRERWQSMRLTDDAQVMSAVGDHLLVLTRGGRVAQHTRNEVEDLSYVRVYEIGTGDRVEAFTLPKRRVPIIGRGADGWVLWDDAFLYRVKAPGKPSGDQGQEVKLPHAFADPDLIASMRLARDLEDPPQMEVPHWPAGPRIDGSLSDWPAAAERRLGSLMDWKPDFVHQSRWKTRTFGGNGDLAAVVRIGQTDDSLYLGAEVTDDIQFASTGAPLWRSDSVTFMFAEASGEQVDPTMLTAALVDGVPRIELGTAVRMIASSDPPGQVPECGPGPRTLVLPAVKGVAPGSASVVPIIEVAIRRDESLHRTVYEMRIPKVAVSWSPRTRWDVLVNENDGHGREGALQLASFGWGIEEATVGPVTTVQPR